MGSPICRVALLPLSRGTVILGLCHTGFTLLGEVHIMERGPAFIPSLRVFLRLPCAWLPLLLNLEGPSCTQASERSFVCLALNGCPCHPHPRCVLPVVESPPLAAPSPCLKGPWMCSGFFPFTDPLAVFGKLLLCGIFIAESIFCFLFSFPFQYFPGLFSLYFLVFSGWGFVLVSAES